MPNDVQAMADGARRIEKDCGKLWWAFSISAVIERGLNLTITILSVLAAVFLFMEMRRAEIAVTVPLLIIAPLNSLLYFGDWGGKQGRASQKCKVLADRARNFHAVTAVGASPSGDLDRTYNEIRDGQQSLTLEFREPSLAILLIASAVVRFQWRPRPAANR